MIQNNNYLFDEEFLEELAKTNQKEVYAKITVLNNNEHPLEQIEGKILDGSINVDGKSVIRRTCNLSMIADNVNLNSFYWGLKNKFILEVGLKNEINKIYPDIVWFKQGLFIITQFNTTQTTNKWEIKISGKDKMCLLNGDISGNLPYEVDFGKQEYHDLENDTVTYTYIPVKEIIRRAVQEFGGEAPQNIIINDIDDAGLILLKYINDIPAYLYKEVNSQEYRNIILKDDITCYYRLKQSLTIDEFNLIPTTGVYKDLRTVYNLNEDGTLYLYNKKLEGNIYQNLVDLNSERWFQGTIGDKFNIHYETFIDDSESPIEPTIVKFFDKNLFNTNPELLKEQQSRNYTLAKMEYGDMPGYFLTDLTYATGDGKSNQNDLIAKTGESITSVLDKIKNMLAHFEYYYDINGKFIFQKKRDYITTPWNNLDNNDIDYELNFNSKNMMFNFLDGILISSFQNNPKLNNIKNDYSVWGSYNNNGTEIPIHMRYAIDKKPLSYRPIRPLREKIHTVIERDGQVLSDTITYKYYDAPEIQPYKDYCLIDLQDGEMLNGFSNSKTIIQSADNTITTTEIYPYFAKYAYTTDNTYYIDYSESDKTLYNKLYESYLDQKIYTNFDDYVISQLKPEEYNQFCKKEILHYGVDWRELIYQMALDYRKCNYDDNFLYYISVFNPEYPLGKTGYEQYYIDLEGFWRTLYNPNPELQFESIQFNEVKNYAQINHSSDLIYIENGYRKIEYNDINGTLKPSDLYCENTPINGLKGMYPFIGSENCCLELDVNYYIENNESMKFLTTSNYDDNNYIQLNDTALYNIYVKDIEPFKGKDNNFYITKLNTENNDTYKKYMVRAPRKQSKNGYSKFIDVIFDQLLNNNKTLDGFYIKDKRKLKLGDVYNGKNNFYDSNLTMFASYAKELKSELASLNLQDYKNNEIQYLFDNIRKIEESILKINQYEFIDLNNSIQAELSQIIQNSITYLLDKIEKFIRQKSISSENSCLVNLFETMIFNLNNIQSSNEKISEGDFILAINLIKDIYQSLNYLLNNINNNLSPINSYYGTLIENVDNITTLESLQKTVNECQSYFISIPDNNKLKNGQIDIIINYLKIISQSIEDFKGNNIEEFINNQKNLIQNNIIKPIEDLKDFQNWNYNKINGNETGIIEYLIIDIYKSFNILLDGISNLTLLLDEDKLIYTKGEISKIITYRRNGQYTQTPILKSLNDLLFITDNEETIKIKLQEYLNRTKDYLEYLIMSNTDNFNRVTKDGLKKEKILYYKGFTNYYKDEAIGNFWSLDINNSPHLLLFWFDFLNADNDFELSEISVPAIGTRTKVITDKNVKAINYKKIPQVIFKRSTDKNYEIKEGYSYININSNTESFFGASAKAKSAKERIEELLYNHSYGASTITISSVPIYHLEPNHHILVRDDKSNINGEFIVDKMTIPLSFKKTMNITATRAVSSIV